MEPAQVGMDMELRKIPDHFYTKIFEHQKGFYLILNSSKNFIIIFKIFLKKNYPIKHFRGFFHFTVHYTYIIQTV